MIPVIILFAIAAFVNITGGLLAADRWLSRSRFEIRELLAAALSAGAVTALTFLVNKGNNDTACLVWGGVICLLFSAIVLKNADKRIALLFFMIYEATSALSFKLAGIAIILFAGKTGFTQPATLPGGLLFFAVSLLISAVALMIYLKQNVSSRWFLRLMAAISITAIVVINAATVRENELIDKDEIDSYLYYALFVMISTLILQMRKLYDAERELAQSKALEAQMLEREYQSLSRSYETNAKLFHDFRNHMGVLKNYLIKDKAGEALSYIEELTGTESSLITGVWTGDDTVDYLIGSKMEAAGKKDISFEAEVEFPRNIDIKSSDLCAVLANLLDNAIEASSKLKDPSERKIRLIIRRIRQMLVIKVENTYENRPQEEDDGHFKSSKTDGGLHGWGIKSAETAAGKYDGTVQSRIDDKFFTTVVTMSFSGIPTA
ncbi:MAG: GHKL domain-containing protein [Lachnospiraceae bacterium]|nr:GHKL domain-containing protein [Lachnospiraceae bacterium]